MEETKNMEEDSRKESNNTLAILGPCYIDMTKSYLYFRHPDEVPYKIDFLELNNVLDFKISKEKVGSILMIADYRRVSEIKGQGFWVLDKNKIKCFHYRLGYGHTLHEGFSLSDVRKDFIEVFTLFVKKFENKKNN